MPCSNCNTPTCGCSGTYVVSATCPPTCSEVFNAQCIVYTGADILCGTDTVIARNAYLDAALTSVVDYVCTNSTRRQEITAAPLPYTGGVDGTVLVTHQFAQTYVSVTIFNGLVDVTSDFTITAVGAGTFNILSGTTDATLILVVA